MYGNSRNKMQKQKVQMKVHMQVQKGKDGLEI